MSMLTTVWAELAEHALLPFEAGRMLPPAAYTSPEVLAEEHRRIFATEWSCVGRTADLPNRGDYLTAEIPSADSDASRTGIGRSSCCAATTGDVSAFDNVCVHRGSPLLHDCGNAARITCPYHAWVYRLDGQLIGAPYMNRTVDIDGKPFDPADHHLTALRLEEWEGFLFVTQDPDAAELLPAADRAHRCRRSVPDGRLRAGASPGRRVGHQLEAAVRELHGRVPRVQGAQEQLRQERRQHAADHDACGHRSLRLPPRRSRRRRHVRASPIRPTRRCEGEWRHTIVLGAAFPTHVMQLQPDWLWYLQLSPLGTGQVRIRWDVSVAPEVLADQADPAAYVADLLDLLNLVNSEDRPIVEGVFRGVQRTSLTRGPLSYFERNVYDFDRYIARSLTGGTTPVDA